MSNICAERCTDVQRPPRPFQPGQPAIATPPKNGAASPSDPLSRYRGKRDAARTNEPFGPTASSGRERTLNGRFVVHLHAARQTHFDLRIQVGGALKSFAVPRGPSLDPNDKRLAINTEDHPLDYLDFEDVIPDGNYGAGAMIVWDEGNISYLDGSAEDGIARAKIDFTLQGHKLRGRFGLVHTGARYPPEHRDHNHWLLIKKRDAHAEPDGPPIIERRPHSVLSSMTVAQLAARENTAAVLIEAARLAGGRETPLDVDNMTPMLCASRGATLHDADRYYELKLDGVRIVAARTAGEISLRYRRRRSAAASYPEIARAVAALPLQEVVLDGEVLAYDARGRPSFQRLAQRIQARTAYHVQRARSQVPVQYVVFDVLRIGPYNLTQLPLSARKALLMQLLPAAGRLRALDHLSGDGRPLMELCDAHDLEGLVAKRASSRYRPGPGRSDDWVKIKRQRDDDFVVVGWEHGRGSRVLGSLLLASYRDGELVLRGKVGSGIDDASQAAWLTRVRASEVSDAPASGEVTRRGERRWVQPRYVVSIRFTGLSEGGHLVHPVYRGQRPDMAPKDCQLGTSEELLSVRLKQPRAPAGRLPVRAADVAARAKLSNQQKLFWPQAGFTKGDLCDYYASVAPQLLPLLQSRPLVMVRYPDGIDGKRFFQWNVPRGTPPWLRTLSLREELPARHANSDEHTGDQDKRKRTGKATFIVDNIDSLLHIANLGCIPIHVLAAREKQLGHCDFLTIDLDLGERPFRDAVSVALSLKEILDAIGMVGFPKTSGRTGLHILIPLGPAVTFHTAQMMIELLGRLLAARHEDTATMQRRVRKRDGRLYIDTGQTGRTRTIVAPYSLRANSHAGVSTPLDWSEIHPALNPKSFTLETVPRRLQQRPCPMRTLLTVRPDIPAAVAALGRLVS